jgi:hypothetical protein
MECRDYKELIIGYSAGDLPESDRMSVIAHIGECEDCRLYLSRSERVWELLDGWQGVEPRSDFVSGFWGRVAREERESGSGFFARFKKLKLNIALAGALATVLIVGMFTFVLFKPDSGFRSYAENDAQDEQILLELDSATTRETADALSIYGPWENRVEIMKINGNGDMN